MRIPVDAFYLDKAAGLTLTHQLLSLCQREIHALRWHAGAKLPSVRLLSEHLAISKFTVADVYERLTAMGLTVSRHGSGVYVARQHPVRQLADASHETSALATEVGLMRQTLQRQTDWHKPAAGWLTPSWLPDAEIRTALKHIAREGHALTDYGPAQGYLPLRQYLVGRLQQLGLQLEPAHMLLTASATQALDLVVRLLFKPGDKVLVDDPGFYNFQAILRLHQLELVYLPRTTQGPDVPTLTQLLQQHKIKAYLTNSVLSNPVGTCVQPQVAFAVLDLLKQHNVLLIEDDIYADFERKHALRYSSLLGVEHCVYIGSLSKTISADLRVGYIVASASLVASLTDLKLMTTTSTPTTVERIIYKVLTSAGYSRHLKQLHERLDECRRHVLQQLATRGCLPWFEPTAGFALWVRLPAGVSAKQLASKAQAHKIVLAPGGHFSQRPDADEFMRFNITQCDEALWQFFDKHLTMEPTP